MRYAFFGILSRNEQYCSEYVDDAHQMITINNSFVSLLLYQDLKDKTFLEVINKYVEVHATVGGGVSVSVSFNSDQNLFSSINNDCREFQFQSFMSYVLIVHLQCTVG